MLKIGHRGVAAIAPENTEYSFLKSIRCKLDMIELDIQLTKDEELVVFHDYDLLRVGKLDKKVSEMNLDELKKVDIGSWFNEKFSKQRILTLRELIKLIKGRLKVNIEIKINLVKREVILLKLVDVLEDECFLEEVVISSFDHLILKKLKEINAKVKTAILLNSLPVNPIRLIEEANADGIHLNFIATTYNIVKLVQSRGYFINVWTVNKKEDFVRLKELGVDGIMSDYPSLFEIENNE